MVAVMTATTSVVVGLGASGLAAARYLSRHGEAVIVLDSRPEPPGLDALAKDCPAVSVELGRFDAAWLSNASQLVLSPGLPRNLPLAEAARENGIEVIGELELFARAAAAPVLAVTGSNGKSTVTSLVSYLLQAQGIDAPAGGNLGPPALELLDAGPVDAYVVEVSSFQLETTSSLLPAVAAVLNISPDHIDRHGSLEQYAWLKLSLLTGAGCAVLNYDDPMLRAAGPSSADLVWFSTETELATGWSILEREGQRHVALDGKPLATCAELGISGRTGEANALAALALVARYGADVDKALEALPGFSGLPHRQQLVGEFNGVRFVDDSKGTNVGATVAALESQQGPVVLIAGGQAKGADLAPLAAAAAGRVRSAVLIGEAAAELEAAFGSVLPTQRAATMEEAVATATGIAAPGDCVLLSPACASQDMFRDYHERGEKFAAAVRQLAAGEQSE